MSKIKHATNAANQVALAPFNPLDAHGQQAIDAQYTPPRPAGDRARYLLVQANTENARYTLSEVSSPTATFGFVITAGDPPVIIPVGGPNVNPQFISETAGCILEYQWLE